MHNPTNSVAKISQDVLGIIQDKCGSYPENFNVQAPHEIPQDLTRISQDRTGIHLVKSTQNPMDRHPMRSHRILQDKSGIHLVKSRPNPIDRHPTRSNRILQRSHKTELGFILWNLDKIQWIDTPWDLTGSYKYLARPNWDSPCEI